MLRGSVARNGILYNQSSRADGLFPSVGLLTVVHTSRNTYRRVHKYSRPTNKILPKAQPTHYLRSKASLRLRVQSIETALRGTHFWEHKKLNTVWIAEIDISPERRHMEGQMRQGTNWSFRAGHSAHFYPSSSETKLLTQLEKSLDLFADSTSGRRTYQNSAARRGKKIY